MANIYGQITVDEILILSVDTDPSISTGLVAPVGSIAILDDDTNGRIWIKSGAGNTSWSIIPRLANATALQTGAVLFADSSGFITGNSARIFWDTATNRLALGANAPAAPQSTIHLDRGTGVGSHIRFTAGSTTGQASSDGFELGIDNAGNAEFMQLENSNMNWMINGTRRLQLNPAGQFIVGGNATAADITGASIFPIFQIIGTSETTNQMATITYSNDNIPSVVNLLKSRGTLGTHAAVQTNDELGRIQFRGSDGTNFQAGASIRGLVESTPASGSMPGFLQFLTTPAGTNVPVERARIDSTGQAIFANNIRIGNGTDTTNGNIRYTGSEIQARVGATWYVIAAPTIALNSTTVVSTTSGTYATLTGMSGTPAAGTYMCYCNVNAGGAGSISLFVGGSQNTLTTRQQAADGGLGAASNNQHGTLSFTTVITVNGSQVVDLRSNASSGTFSVGNREIILVPVSR